MTVQNIFLPFRSLYRVCLEKKQDIKGDLKRAKIVRVY
jgi:hypothetical protein